MVLYKQIYFAPPRDFSMEDFLKMICKLPLNLFVPKFRYDKAYIIPIQDGMLPDILLLSAAKYLNKYLKKMGD